ncbi:BTAD domain-containing putative transcriptional regulator [Streptomyces sp. NPDC020681]|uniref:BTAD domain-containing putative transcriptional regulator n=1 Tax=Streptomyces sp. NPDC020681 TaxID=3365083 RepID=UPI0037A3DB56
MTTTTREPLRVALLGSLRAWRGDVELGLGPSRQRAVFAMLAVHANHVVSREELIDGVWGQDRPASVDGSLHTYVSGMRRALEPHHSGRGNWQVLATLASGYRLHLDPDGLDLHRLHVLREQARHQWSGNDAASAVRTLDAALELWNGDAFTGVPGPFAEGERARLCELRVNCQEQRAEAALAIGAHREAVADLTGLLRDHPLREELRRLLMIALCRCGRNAEALEVFQDGQRVLARELSVSPGAALRQVHQQILANDPALSGREPESPSVPTTPHGNSSPAAAVQRKRASQMKLVGRQSELKQFRQQLSEVAGGTGGVLWVEGEPGIGKTQLLATGLAQANDAGCHLAWASSDQMNLFPLRVMMDCLEVTPDSPDPRRAELAAALHTDSPAPTIWSQSDPLLWAIDRILGLVDKLCAEAPLVLVMDDLQWADEASLLVWHRLCPLTKRIPLLMVGACRLTPRRAELDTLRFGVESSGGRVLDLGPLAPSAAVELIGQVAGAQPGPRLRAWADRAAGNPLYLREMAEVMAREGVLHLDAATADIADESYELSVSLASMVSRRLDFLSHDTREVLCRAALLGVEFALTDLAAVLDRPVSDLLSLIEEAMSSRIVVDAGPRLAFRHPLVREALYGGIPMAERIALHRYAAEALAGVRSPVERVAEQLVAAEVPVDRWVLDWVAANISAVTRRAPGISAYLLRKALQVCPSTDGRWEALAAELARLPA